MLERQVEPEAPDGRVGETGGAVEPPRVDLPRHGPGQPVVVCVDDGLVGAAEEAAWELVEEDGEGEGCVCDGGGGCFVRQRRRLSA